MNLRRGSIVVGLLVWLITAGMVPIAGGAVETASAASASDQPTVSLEPQTPQPSEPFSIRSGLVVQADNETDRPLHEHPDRTSGNGDSGVLSERLARELARRLEESTTNISEGEYERGEELLGPEYRDRIAQYTEVTGEADGDPGSSGESDRRTAGTFVSIADRQRNLSQTLRTYNETRSSYRRAYDRGNETHARELARDLIEITNRIERLSQELRLRYDRLESAAGADLTGERRALNRTLAETTNATEQITSEVFVDTTVTVSTESTRISYRDPLVVQGRLVDEDGAGIPDARILVPDSAVPSTTRTDEQGRFTLSYRPVGREPGEVSIPVQYRPERTGKYQSDEESATVEIARTEAAVTVRQPSNAVAFGDQLVTRATVTVDDSPVAGVPLWFVVGGIRAQARTAPNGTATFTPTVTTDAPTGEQVGYLSVAGENSSLTLADGTTDVQVQSMNTTLTVDVTPVDASGQPASGDDVTAVHAEGQLTSVEGTAVPNRTVDILVDGQLVSAATVGSDGRFDTVVDVPTDRGTITLSVAYEDLSTNLASSTTRTTLDLGSRTDRFDSGHPLAILGGIALFVSVGAVVAYRRGLTSLSGDPGDGGVDHTTGDTSSADSSGLGPDPDVLAAARERLESAPDRATTLAYGSVRRALEDRVDATDSLTHWEFHRLCAADGLADDHLAALERVTECYEEAVFTPTGIEAGRARDAIEAAEELASESAHAS